jgi:pyruvate/2-oxoglutarate dehydrogenase complex dihydrolipoamide acyltransferase (E2) component
MAMPRIAKPRVLEESRQKAAANRRSVSHANEPEEPVDEVERKFLEPVARYLAILQEWSLERLSDGTGTVPKSEQP